MQPAQFSHRILMMVNANIPERVRLAIDHIDSGRRFAMAVATAVVTRGKCFQQTFHQWLGKGAVEHISHNLKHLPSDQPIALYRKTITTDGSRPRQALSASPAIGPSLAVDHGYLPL